MGGERVKRGVNKDRDEQVGGRGLKGDIVNKDRNGRVGERVKRGLSEQRQKWVRRWGS